MQIMIDGHNLIPNIPGLRLSDLDDEQRLIEMVQEYCRIRRRRAEIYFDNASPGFAKKQSVGAIKVKFAVKGRTADQDIKDRLAKLGKEASNWLVVTSDHSIQTAARTARAQIISSGDFAKDLWDALYTSSGEQPVSEEAPLSEDEIAHWMKMFRQGKSD